MYGVAPPSCNSIVVHVSCLGKFQGPYTPPPGHSPYNSHWNFPHRHILYRNPSRGLPMPLAELLLPAKLLVNPLPLQPLLLVVATLCHYQSPHQETSLYPLQVPTRLPHSSSGWLSPKTQQSPY
ncbi:hypothetical protein AMTR_s00132p00097150 [Amborella trichopoda]|uniref:Uncharacterized protein n=1 Tax=Amborella trichopoda TaxID=13333 RepID=W1NDR1_AMBTC|nr:hypothetical protein AMTR_s00132p00097150 [Amborella trichopoda]